MKKNSILAALFISFLFFSSISAQPVFKDNKLFVNEKPFIMIAGELHNSTASSIPYLEKTWPKLKSLHLNTVLATISWDQFEPVEGKYDFTLIDYLIKESENNGLKLVVVWFGSWKNGESSYAPIWVKKDTKRFPRVQAKDGRLIETLSVFSENTKNADAKAFAQLLKRIKENDKNQTVIMVQPENEVGIFQEIDFRKEVLAEFGKAVPTELMKYIKKNKNALKPELKSVWEAAGSKNSGSWATVFGDNPQAKEFFMAWNYASYINFVAEKGRAEYNVPMFVNAWIVQKPDDLPGVYPNGGPVSRVLDIYKAAAPKIDVVSPDIYLENYKEIYEMYYRKADNALLVPESSLDAARAFYAYAEFDGICFSPFGIEDAAGDILYSESNRVLNELLPTISAYQGTGKMRGVHLTKNYQDHVIQIDGVTVTFKIQDPEKPAYGLIIKTGELDFLISGMNFKVSFDKKAGKSNVFIGKVAEGKFENNTWVEGRLLNGDETFHHLLVRVFGREYEVDQTFVNQKTNLEVQSGEQFVYSPGSSKKIQTPGIYKVQLYTRNTHN
jgi:hypothetical protein